MKSIKNFLVLVLCFASSLTAIAQSESGVIIYNRKVNYVSIMTRLPFLSSEEIDRINLTWGKNSENKGQNHDYYYSEGKSLYTRSKEENNNGYSWSQEKYLLFRDHKKQTVKDWREILGNRYLIEDDLPKRKWKILNEIKEVQGYLCMKAETYDPIKDQTIHAWFADGIIFSGGPEGYAGLPGMILEININYGDVVITATSVKLTQEKIDLPMPKKMKGKPIKIIDFNTIVRDYITESIEAERNPYWRIRY